MSPIDGRSLIIDTDMGPDDAWALLFLFKAASYYNLKILGITCSHGNTDLENVAKNTMRFLEMVNRLDVPVYLGAKNSIIQDEMNLLPFFGTDGFGDIVYTTKPHLNFVKNESAISAMYRLVKEHKNVTLLCLAPLTNIALALRVYPNFIDYIDQVFIMGGNFIENKTVEQTAEFNFMHDPEAANIVLKINKPLIILPWDTVIPPKLHLKTSWRFGVLGTVDNKIIQFLNLAEKVYEKGEIWTPADPILTIIFLNPKNIISRAKLRYVNVEIHDPIKRGVMIAERHSKNGSNAIIVEKINENYLKRMFLWVAGMKNYRTKSILKPRQYSKNKWIDLESVEKASSNYFLSWIVKYICK